MHYIYTEVHYVIKGHVAIELHNHKTGLRDRIEGDNMVTNAKAREQRGLNFAKV